MRSKVPGQYPLITTKINVSRELIVDILMNMSEYSKSIELNIYALIGWLDVALLIFLYTASLLFRCVHPFHDNFIEFSEPLYLSIRLFL